GEWHLYFQHNPVSRGAHNMTWGHAVSRDLLHWEQLGNALFPRSMARGWCFSGSAIVDKRNDAGFRSGEEPPILAFFSDTDCGECIAYSNDRGRTFTYYKNNPVVKHNGRDPKIIWYAPGRHWVMAVHDEEDQISGIAFYTSTNLKDWTRQSKLDGYHECAELFELPVDGNKDNTQWVIFGGDAKYATGTFDGKRFTPEHEKKQTLHFGRYYASQTFNNPPDGRRIQVGWAQTCGGRTFSQTFSFPHRLTLRTTADGVRLFAGPVGEIEKLYKKKHSAKSQELTETTPVQLDVSAELLDVRATFEVGNAKTVGLDIGGNRVLYDVIEKQLVSPAVEDSAPMTPVNGKVIIRVLVDRPMLEIIGNDGRVYITTTRPARGDVKKVRAVAAGGQAKLLNLEVNELESIWKK
ncbi:MAG: glycoside hydrolase family 32 protein, partial [Candidatus Nealsonbacteria bacterium]|nr:glycoside hydrolase family 32 protein [Candidatus Nealsonbacteria bacterium]